jgi:triphosphatase
MLRVMTKNPTLHRSSVPPLAEAVKGRAAKLSKKMTVEQAFQAISVNCMDQIQANRDAVAHNQDVESLHQMRVGLRRLTSALQLFGDFFRIPDDLRRDLDWLGERLGEARDWDVLSESTLPRVVDGIEDKFQLIGINTVAAVKSAEQHAALSEAVSSRRYKRLIFSFARWVHSGDWRDAMPRKRRKQLASRISEFARDLLSHEQHRLLKRGGKLSAATPKARHKVRIAAKKARYAAEFFQSLLPKTKPYIKSLSHLQDELGRLNDISVADRLLKELTGEHIELQESAALVRGYLAASAANDVKKINGLWKKFSSAKLPH